MGSIYIAAIVSLSAYLGNDIVAGIIFQELVVNVHLYTLRILREIGAYPDDGLCDHLVGVRFVELKGCVPSID